MSIPEVGLHFKTQKYQKLNLLKFRTIENRIAQIVDKYMGYQQIFFILEGETLNVGYYSVLHKVQHSEGDITEWLDLFLNCLYGY